MTWLVLYIQIEQELDQEKRMADNIVNDMVSIIYIDRTRVRPGKKNG